jgi:hypothetical protein
VAGRGGDGPTFALLGELDALVVTGHPVADPQTGPRTPAATTPGRRASRARLWACSTPRPSITWPGAWCSSPVPAEEYGDVEWRVAAGTRPGRLGIPRAASPS